ERHPCPHGQGYKISSQNCESLNSATRSGIARRRPRASLVAPLMKTPRFPHVITRRKFVGQLALGATALALASRGRAQGAWPNKLGVALVGLGTYARGQLGPALKLTENCRLMGVVTGSKEKGQKWAQDYEFPE